MHQTVSQLHFNLPDPPPSEAESQTLTRAYRYSCGVIHLGVGAQKQAST